MGEVIHIARGFTKERVDKMNRTYDTIIKDLREKNTYDDMPGAADALLAFLSDDEYPVPVIRVAKRLGFKVFEADLEDEELSGLISIDEQWNKQYRTSHVIIVNEKDSSEHKRFTIAHELAHYLFDAEPGQEYSNTYRTDESEWNESDKNLHDRERVANYFAANLLMPSVAFRRKYNELTLDVRLSSELVRSRLSEYFGVPETAVRIRCQELKIS